MIKSYPFDPYKFYQASVQSPEYDVQLFSRLYFKMYGVLPKSFREDFCGTHALCCQWVKLRSQNQAWGLDLDPEPLMWGLKHNQVSLTPKQRERLFIIQGNVLVPELVKTEIVAALNFSYFVFKTRKQLRDYFSNVRGSIKNKGFFILDVFGGSQCQGPVTDKKKVKGFEYQWEQKNFDVISHHADFAIHFKYQGKLYSNVFTYNWRLWTIPELIELLTEAGFASVQCYWEGTDAHGCGNGRFCPVKKASSCESWIGYLVAKPLK
jgi:hypothetical protein